MKINDLTGVTYGNLTIMGDSGELSNPKTHKRIDRLDVIDIYLDDRSAKDIAQEYEVSVNTIYNIKNKTCHKVITNELDKDY